MPPVLSPSLLRFPPCFSLSSVCPLALELSSVGAISKVTGQAQIGGAMAVVGTPVHMGDRLRTGANARLQVTFHDSSSLTLGENANVVVDRFVFNPEKARPTSSSTPAKGRSASPEARSSRCIKRI